MISTTLPSNPLAVTPILDGPVRTGFSFDNRIFFSYQEVLCYQYLQSIGFRGNKMHMEFRVGRNHFDFFPLKRVFWEHHPIIRKIGKDLTKYALKRRSILDFNGYAHIPLVVSDCMFTGVADINQQMSSIGVDFRTGNVPDSSIVYITESVEEPEKMVVRLLMEPLMF